MYLDNIIVIFLFAGKEEGSKWVQVDGMLDQLSVSISGIVWAIMHDKVTLKIFVSFRPVMSKTLYVFLNWALRLTF